jgi:hypothetical protein
MIGFILAIIYFCAGFFAGGVCYLIYLGNMANKKKTFKLLYKGKIKTYCFQEIVEREV